MCLSIPSKIIQFEAANVAIVDTMGVQRQVSLDLIDQEVGLGDYVLIHVGFAMTKMDEADALESLKLYRQMVELLDAEDVGSEESTKGARE